MKSTNFNSGFTLIEFLIVIGILSLSVGSVLMLLTATIKGSNQTNITAEVRQNGQIALDSIEKHLRNAKDVRVLTAGELSWVPTANSSGILITLADTNKITIVCVNVNGTTDNGYLAIAKTTAQSDIAPPLNAAGYQILTNNSDQGGISVDCYPTINSVATPAFQVTTGVSNVKIASVNFVASQSVDAPSRADFLAKAQFSTTLSIRQYN